MHAASDAASESAAKARMLREDFDFIAPIYGWKRSLAQAVLVHLSFGRYRLLSWQGSNA